MASQRRDRGIATLAPVFICSTCRWPSHTSENCILLYTTNSQPPYPVTSVNGRSGAVALNDGFSTDGTSMWWDAFSSQLRIQVGTWSIGAAPGSSVTVSFPKAFPNYCIFAIPVPDSSLSTAAATEQVGVGGRTNTTVTFTKGKGDTDARGGKYLAIGF